MADALGVRELGEAAAGLSSENAGQRIGAGERIGRLGITAASIAPAGRVGGIRILEREGAHFIGAFTAAKGEARFVGELVRQGDDLIVRGAHVEGDATLRELIDAAREFGREQGVKRVIIQGGRRTTGANPGHTPRPLTIETGL